MTRDLYLPSLISIMILGCMGLFWINNTQNPSTQSTIPTSISDHNGSDPYHPISSACIEHPEIHFFMYHYVRAHDPRDNASTTDLSVDPGVFDAHMSYIQQLAADKKITLMSGKEFFQSLDTHCFPGDPIWMFTSDDGWSDMYTELYPISQRHRIPFLLGIIVDRLDTKGFMTTDQVIEMSKNPSYEITSHSIDHDDESKMTESDTKNTLCHSKNKLESIIGMPVLGYIYPAGRMHPDARKIAKECGYKAAWSTQFGTDWDPNNPSVYDINRIRIHGDSTIAVFEKRLLTKK